VNLKGGTGKTKVVGELGRALRRAGKSVSMADCDYRAPDLDIELGLGRDAHPGRAPGNRIRPVGTPEGFEFFSFVYLYPRDQAISLPEDIVVADIEDALGKIAWNPSDFLLVDSAPTTSGTVRAAFRAENLLGAVCVTQPSKAARADLLRTLSLLQDSDIPALGVVCNQAYYVCPHGEEVRKFDLRARDIQKVCSDWGVPWLGEVPEAVGSQPLAPHFDGVVRRMLDSTPAVPRRKPALREAVVRAAIRRR